jgi:hypothetical protein
LNPYQTRYNCNFLSFDLLIYWCIYVYVYLIQKMAY